MPVPAGGAQVASGQLAPRPARPWWLAGPALARASRRRARWRPGQRSARRGHSHGSPARRRWGCRRVRDPRGRRHGRAQRRPW
eukprot:14567154-Alexandrium_andersonii.AAC.1